MTTNGKTMNLDETMTPYESVVTSDETTLTHDKTRRTHDDTMMIHENSYLLERGANDTYSQLVSISKMM